MDHFIVPGYVAEGKTVVTCDYGVWTPSLTSVVCLEAVVLIAGGFYGTRTNQVEVWAADGKSKRLSDIPLEITGHSVDYIGGGLLLCGGNVDDLGINNKCFMGEYQPSTKGTLVHCYSAQTMQYKGALRQ